MKFSWQSPSAKQEFSPRFQLSVLSVKKKKRRKKSKTNGSKCTLSQDSVMRQRISSKGRDERRSGFLLAFELTFAALPYDFEQDMRSSLIAKEQLHLCQCGPYDSCGLAGKEGQEQMWGGQSQRRESNLNTNQRVQGVGGKNTKEGGGGQEERGKEWSVCCSDRAPVVFRDNSTCRREEIVPSWSWN